MDTNIRDQAFRQRDLESASKYAHQIALGEPRADHVLSYTNPIKTTATEHSALETHEQEWQKANPPPSPQPPIYLFEEYGSRAINRCSTPRQKHGTSAIQPEKSKHV